MRRVTGAFLFVAVVAAASRAQQDDQPTYRDFSAVRQMRVVCSNEHFGRVRDLVVDLQTGKITAAVVAMQTSDGLRLVGLPFGEMIYDPRSNLFDLGECLEDDQHAAFDVAKVAFARKIVDGEATDDLEGTVLMSELADRAVVLRGGEGSAQGLTIEVRSGHLAFVDVAVGVERAGDRHLHPVPWSAFACKAAGPSTEVSLALTLARSEAFVRAAPTLIEIIVRDPLRRARVYGVFEVPRPEFDTGTD